LGVASFPRVSRSFAMAAESERLAESRRKGPDSLAPRRKSPKLSDSLNWPYTRVSGQTLAGGAAFHSLSRHPLFLSTASIATASDPGLRFEPTGCASSGCPTLVGRGVERPARNGSGVFR